MNFREIFNSMLTGTKNLAGRFAKGTAQKGVNELLKVLGESLQQAGGAQLYFKIPKNDEFDFLGKNQAKAIMFMFESYYNLKDLFAKSAPLYVIFVETYYKKFKDLLENYIKFFDKLKKIRSFIKLYEFKGDLKTHLNNMKIIATQSGYKNNTLKTRITDQEKEIAKEGIMGDFIDKLFIPLLKSSITNLEGNDPEQCAIYIGDENNNGFKLDFSKLGLDFSDQEQKIINDQINSENLSCLEKLKINSEQLYKEAEKINQEINNNQLKITSKISKNVLPDDKERYGFVDLSSNYEKIKKDVNDKFEELEKLKETVLKEKKVLAASKSCKEIENNVKIIKDQYDSSLLIYNKIFDYLNNFMPYISEINNWKKDIEKWIKGAISQNKLFNNEVIKGIIHTHKKYFNIFYNPKEVTKETDLVKDLKKAKIAYNLISELNKIVSNEKVFNYYNEIDQLGFQAYGQLIKKEFNDSIEKILSKDIEKEFAISVDKELKTLKENVSLLRQYDKAFKDFELLCKNDKIQQIFLKKGIEKIRESMETTKNMKDIKVQEAQFQIKQRITEIEGTISCIKKSILSKTDRIKIKANSLKDKIKGKLGIGSKSKNGEDEKKGNNTVEEKKESK